MGEVVFSKERLAFMLAIVYLFLKQTNVILKQTNVYHFINVLEYKLNRNSKEISNSK